MQFGEKITVSAATEKFGLTRQEHNILHLLMEGKDNSFICDDLSISINTLKKHILNIYRKLHAILLLLPQPVCHMILQRINTLKKHILNIYRKLGIRNRVQLFKKIREKE